MSDELLTCAEVAAILRCSTDTVMRRWKELGGILLAGSEGSVKRRRYRVARFPKSAIEKHLSRKAGQTIMLQPIRIAAGRKRDDWEDVAARKLAAAIVANAETDQHRRDWKMYDRIRSHARVLAAFVPRNLWKEVVFWDETGEDEAVFVTEDQLESVERPK